MVDYFKLWLIEQSNGAVASIGFTFRKLLFAAIMKQTWHVGRNAKRWEKTTWWRHMVVKDCLQSTTYFPAPDTDDYVHIITYIRIHCVYVYNNIYIYIVSATADMLDWRRATRYAIIFATFNFMLCFRYMPTIICFGLTNFSEWTRIRNWSLSLPLFVLLSI